MTRPLIPVSVGELFDKLSILEIKSERITDQAKLANVKAEYRALDAVCVELTAPASFDHQYAELKQVNETLWEIEDAIRRFDLAGNFGPGFVDLARRVYQTNDRRAALKKQINLAFGSDLVEEKSYEEHSG